jgi:hypothetical protein
VIAGLASASLLVTAPQASAYLYFATENADTIARAALNGDYLEAYFIQGASDPGGVAVNSNYIYWANQGNGTIGRAAINGSEVNQSFISGQDDPVAVAVNANHIYWTSGLGEAVWRASLDGSSVEEIANTSGVGRPVGIAATNSAYYVSFPGAVAYGIGNLIAEGPAEGTGAHEFVKVDGGNGTPLGLALNGSRLFWGDGWNRLGSVDLSGAEPNEDFISAAEADYVAVDASYIYWTAPKRVTGCGGGDTGAIGAANINGTGVTPELIPCAYNPSGIAVDELTAPPPSAPVLPPPSGGAPAADQTVTGAEISSSLREDITPHGISLSKVRKAGGLSMSVKALEAGTIDVNWYAASHGKQVLIASGHVVFVEAATKTLRMKLTRTGLRVLRHARSLKVMAKGSFTPAGGTSVTTTKRFSIAH